MDEQPVYDDMTNKTIGIKHNHSLHINLLPVNSQSTNNPMNPNKYFYNWKYYWSQGHDIANDHTIPTYIEPKYVYQYQATRQNLISGSQKCAHCNIF